MNCCDYQCDQGRNCPARDTRLTREEMAKAKAECREKTEPKPAPKVMLSAVWLKRVAGALGLQA